MLNFRDYIRTAGQTLEKGVIRCLQVNMGYRCNLQCSHCHVEAGPDRQEMMDGAIVEEVLSFVDKAGIQMVDITGGAPEMNPHLKSLLRRLKQTGNVERVLLRTNLSILGEAEYRHYPEIFAGLGVELVASMPCYLEENVEIQRGKGVYHKNVKMLQRLNILGYGSAATGLNLHLVYNPVGNFLPGPQAELETAYREHLKSTCGVVFNSLFTITNMPIGRFREQLEKQGLLDSYVNLLIDSYNPDNLAKVMCRDLISVDWQGRIFDCDFNQVLRLPAAAGKKLIGQVGPGDFTGKAISVGDHCFACVAGSGSSCQGSLKTKAG